MASTNSLFGRIGVTSKPRETSRKTGRTAKKPSSVASKSGISKTRTSTSKNTLADNSLFQAISGTRKTGNSKTATQQTKKKTELITKSIDSSVFKDKKVTAPSKHDAKKYGNDKNSDSNNKNGIFRRGRNNDNYNSHGKASTETRKNQQHTQFSDRQSGTRRDQRSRNTNSNYNPRENQRHEAITTESPVSDVAISSYPTLHVQPSPLPSSSSMQFHYPQDINPSYSRPGMGHASNPHSFSIRNASLPPILVLRNLAPGTSMADVRTVCASLGTIIQCRTQTQPNNTVMAEIVFQDSNMASLGVQQFHGAVADGQVIQAEITKTQLIPTTPHRYVRPNGYIDSGDMGQNQPQYGTAGIPPNDKNLWEGPYSQGDVTTARRSRPIIRQ